MDFGAEAIASDTRRGVVEGGPVASVPGRDAMGAMRCDGLPTELNVLCSVQSGRPTGRGKSRGLGVGVNSASVGYGRGYLGGEKRQSTLPSLSQVAPSR